MTLGGRSSDMLAVAKFVMIAATGAKKLPIGATVQGVAPLALKKTKRKAVNLEHAQSLDPDATREFAVSLIYSFPSSRVHQAPTIPVAVEDPATYELSSSGDPGPIAHVDFPARITYANPS